MFFARSVTLVHIRSCMSKDALSFSDLARRHCIVFFGAVTLLLGLVNSGISMAADQTTRADGALPLEWIDAATGHRVVRLSTEANTRSLYFHQNSLTPDGRAVIVSSPKGISTIDLTTRKNQLIVSGEVTPLFVGRKT